MKKLTRSPANRPWITYLLCAGIGAALFLAVYGVDCLNVTNDTWILNGYIETDITQRYAGWLAYRAADSFFPLTWSPLVSYPFGGYTSLCDSIPLLEILFKALSPLLPATFQFEGLTALLNLTLQGLCAGLLVGLFTQDRCAILLGSSLFCLSPVLWERVFRHTSLTFHWLLLLAIYCYVRTRRSQRPAPYLGLAALCVASVWLHLYFTPMLLGFFLAAVLEAVARRQRQKALLGAFVLTLALCLGSAKLLGALDIGVSNTSGYGTMGLNLNALFNPASLGANWWVPGQGRIDWSLFLPMRAYANNGMESFNYLGVGVLAGLGLAAAALLWRYRKRPALLLRKGLVLLRSHLFLFCFALFSAAFAVTHVVCAFSYTLFTLPLPEPLLQVCNAFRASGRLFWSVNYLLVLACVCFALRHFSPKKWAVRGLLVGLVALQLLDLSPALAQKHTDFAQPQTWSGQTRVEQIVAYGDGRSVLLNLELRDDRALCAALLKQGISSNLWLISRDDYGVAELTEYMDQARQALLQGQDPDPNCLYCTADGDLAAQIAAAQGEGCLVAESEGLWYIRPAS